jgi:poly-gamma-glutamate synthesis protein (capsule biosynthesis protein)
MIRILFGGDVCPMGRIQEAFVEGSPEDIFHDLLEEINASDLSIVNLECPFVSKETPIDKAGGVILGANARCIRGFAAAKWRVLNLANNHSFDHGAKGLRETIQTIKEAGLGYVGAGENIDEAQTPLVKEIDCERVVIYAMAENEYSIADEKMPGANPLDLINCVNAIRRYKQGGIFIIILHGGKEHYPYPTPEMVRRCRFMVDMGADAVICCHAHCPLPWEIYADRPIVYGLGNLVFESSRAMPDSWYEGYLAALTIEDRGVALEIIPYFQSQGGLGARKMDEGAQERFLDEMKRRNAQTSDPVFLQNRWAEFCSREKKTYLTELFGYNRYMRKMSRLLIRTLHSRKEVLTALHLCQCETHREVLNTLFKHERKTE